MKPVDAPQSRHLVNPARGDELLAGERPSAEVQGC